VINDVNATKHLEKAPHELPKDSLLKTLPRFKSDFSYDYQGVGQVYTSKINVVGRRMKTAKEESVLAARKIADLAREKPSLCLLPGPDSQLMFHSFCEAGVTFNAVILKFRNDLNSVAVKEAVELCESRNVKPMLVEIDIIDFLESGKFFDYAEKYKCRAPEVCLHLWLFDQINTAPLLSGRFAVPLIHEGFVYWAGIPTDLHVPYFGYFEEKSRVGEPWFFLNSSEFAGSFLELSSNQGFKKLEFKTTDSVNWHERFITASHEMGYKLGGLQKTGSDFDQVKKYYDNKLALTNGDAFASLFTLPLEVRTPPARARRQMVPLSLYTGKPDGRFLKPLMLNCSAIKAKLFGA